MNTIDITTIIGTELKSRASARDFAKYLCNMQMSEVCVDFSRVNSVTRSFIDEFYQLLLKPDKNLNVTIHLRNMDKQVKAYLQSVKQTSVRSRSDIKMSDARFINLQTVQQLYDYLASIKQ